MRLRLAALAAVIVAAAMAAPVAEIGIAQARFTRTRAAARTFLAGFS
jgi:hypothetical protein